MATSTTKLTHTFTYSFGSLGSLVRSSHFAQDGRLEGFAERDAHLGAVS
jgi:hypothetical protein